MAVPLDETILEDIIAEYRHVREEHRRAGREGRVRRHLGDRLERLERRFDSLLEEWVADEAARDEWRRRLHAESPVTPTTPRRMAPLLFKGRSKAGSIVEVRRRRRDGECDVLVDGALVERIDGRMFLRARSRPLTLEIGDTEFEEIFDAPPASLAAAEAFFRSPSGEPPWQHAPELAADGLIDGTFALTPRGRRALAAKLSGR